MHILCVCTGNTCRSPMLAALLRAQLTAAGRLDVLVESAGTGAADGDPASAGAQRAMARRGLDLDGHVSRNLQEVDLSAVDLILCMSSAHAAAVRAQGVPPQMIQVVQAEQGGVPDPYGGDDRIYEQCAAVLERAAHRVAAGR
jgi:protein-tyrosine-phosphatase